MLIEVASGLWLDPEEVVAIEQTPANPSPGQDPIVTIRMFSGGSCLHYGLSSDAAAKVNEALEAVLPPPPRAKSVPSSTGRDYFCPHCGVNITVVHQNVAAMADKGDHVRPNCPKCGRGYSLGYRDEEVR